MDRLIFSALAALGASSVAAAGTPAVPPLPVNVLQDCWTGDVQRDQTRELEKYSYAHGLGESITFVWKHKILEPCQNYTASIFGFECREGKPRPTTPAWAFPDIRFGPIDNDPGNPEPLLDFVVPADALPPGVWDWILFVECNDSGTGIPLRPDGDIDDECGINQGVAPSFAPGPRLFGFEPARLLDADPGGFPPGRLPGESGTTRPWCFEVRPPPLP